MKHHRYAMILYAKQLFLLALLTALPASLPAETRSIDLSGEWEIVSAECLPGERHCAEKLKERNHFSSVSVPKDLHGDHPWFYGTLKLRTTFQYDGRFIRPVLILGAVASADRTLLNGKIIGTTPPRWNAPRQYLIHGSHLKEGLNVLEVETLVLDEKAGIFRGPVTLAESDDLAEWIGLPILLHLYIPFGIAIFLIVVLFYVIAALALRIIPGEYVYCALAIFFVLFYVAMFIPVDVGIPYLQWKQMCLFGALMASVFNMFFFYSLIEKPSSLLRWSLLIGAPALSALHFLPSTYYGLYLFSIFGHVLVAAACIALAVVFTRTFFVKRSQRNVSGMVIALGWLPALGVTYDFFIRLGMTPHTPVFIYLIPFFVLCVLLIQAQMLINSTRREKELEGRAMEMERDFRERLRESREKERRKIFGDIHDHMGGQLTDIHLQLNRMLEEGRIHRPGISNINARIKKSISGMRAMISSAEDFETITNDFSYGLHLALLRRYSAAGRILEFNSHEDIDRFLREGRDTREELTMAIYSIAQEVANNDLKYGQGPTTWKFEMLDGHREFVSMTVSAATAYDRKVMRGGFGEKNIRRRLVDLGGSMKVRMERNKCTVEILIPHGTAGAATS